MKDLITFIKKNSIGTYKKDVKLEKNTTYKVGGVASLFVYPKNTDKLIILLDKLNKEGIKHKVLGFGSKPNTLCFIPSLFNLSKRIINLSVFLGYTKRLATPPTL